ncbi:putative F-box/LRR-repeat protein C02F5.7 [Nymphon striatum]|nr:putative F-box/LRR-repeat protein C02F5.7 [Nymphon striatum]
MERNIVGVTPRKIERLIDRWTKTRCKDFTPTVKSHARSQDFLWGVPLSNIGTGFKIKVYRIRRGRVWYSNIDSLPDKVILSIFTYLPHREICRLARVCRKWLLIAHDTKLWQNVSLRPEYSGLHITSIEYLLSLIGVRFGTYEKTEEEEEEIYEVINIHKLKSATPNLRVVNLYGIVFVDDSHVEAFSSNCIHLECLAINYCNKVTGSSLKILLARCKRLKCLLMQQCGLLDQHVMAVDWEKTAIHELDITGTELSTECLTDILTRITSLRYLSAGAYFKQCKEAAPKPDAVSSRQLHSEAFKTISDFINTEMIQNNKVMLVSSVQDLYEAEYCSLGGREDDIAVYSIQALTRKLKDTFEDKILLSNYTKRQGNFLYSSSMSKVDARARFHGDEVLKAWTESGSTKNLIALDLDRCDNLTEECLYKFLKIHAPMLRGLALSGIPVLTEQFWSSVIPYLKNIKILVMGMPEGCCQKIHQKIHIDQLMDGIANNCLHLERLEIGWDMETLRFSDRSSKSIDLCRVKCLKLRCLALNDGKYFELVKSNFVRADRTTVVRTTTNCRVTNLYLLLFYKDLLFN